MNHRLQQKYTAKQYRFMTTYGKHKVFGGDDEAVEDFKQFIKDNYQMDRIGNFILKTNAPWSKGVRGKKNLSIEDKLGRLERRLAKKEAIKSMGKFKNYAPYVKIFGKE